MDAYKEANRANHCTQAVIGAKEGIALGLCAKLGERIANTVLWTADVNDEKGIDKYELHELVQALHRHAQRPQYAALRNILAGIAAHRFHFQREFASNVTNLKTKAGKL